MSVMFEADNEDSLKERLTLAVSRLKELHQEGLPDIDQIEKTGKPFACFLNELIREALKGVAGEPSVAPGGEPAAEKAAAEYPDIAAYIRLLFWETKRITSRGLEEDVIRLELILQVLGEILCKAEEGEKVLTPETFQEPLYWFCSDYSETVLKHCLRSAAKSGLSFPEEYAKSLPYAPGFLEWGDLTSAMAENKLPGEFAEIEAELFWQTLSDANLATRRLEGLSEALKELNEAGETVRTEFVIAEELCEKNRNYRHFIKRLKEMSEHVENNIILAGGADH